VAHSTAEAELIAYCESLVVGRATEALLASIWQQWDFEKVIYGDNAAAINLAHGVSTASWRTRHLRIRASVLKEALDESKGRIGGGWKLLHLKGTELVADGCTKPLQGQTFTQFVDDLGLRRTRREHRPVREDRPAAGGEHHGAAMRAMVIGSVLLSTAEAYEEEPEADGDFTWIWVTGAFLMAMGAIYTGQLLHSALKFCMRRLQVSEEGGSLRLDPRRNDVSSSEDEEFVVVSKNEGGALTGITSSKARSRSGLHGGASASASSSTLRPRLGSHGCDSMDEATLLKAGRRWARMVVVQLALHH